ncbi:nucleoid-associated protein [Psychrobacillus sp.]|uniref:nucleoid-associated protein n=1 Tax=Psychrobacillus sp. TaxID=1871623 RepID=UPI0028BEBD86|nr:nucleoid-associated protein [Psychrobacillus sp.]
MITNNDEASQNESGQLNIEESAATVVEVELQVATNAEASSAVADEIPNKETVSFHINNLAITLLNMEKSQADFATKCIKLIPEDHKVFYDFFQTHIEQTRYGKNTRECKFTDSDNSILTKINRYEQNKSEENFIIFTNEVTKNLFTFMKESTKSSGSFFVLDALHNEEEVIIFLKLDPKNGVQLDPETLDIKEIKNMLPESNDRVHKCAIIRKNYVANSTNLFVLDRQQKAGETSKFFMSKFLQAIAIPNNNIKTVALLNELYTKIEAKLPDTEKEQINTAIDSEFNNGATIHIPETVKNIYEKLISQETEDREILIEEYKTHFVSDFATKYKDYGLALTIDREENKVLYNAPNNKILFRYNKDLHNNEVTVLHNKTDDIYNITIRNNASIGFEKKIR